MLNESLKLQSHTLARLQPWNEFSLGTAATSTLYPAVSELNFNKINPRERTVAKFAGSVSVIATTWSATIRTDGGIAHDKSDAAFTIMAFHTDASGPGKLLFETIVGNRRIEPLILHFASRRDDGQFTDKTEDLRRVGQIRYNTSHGEVSLVVVLEDRNHTGTSPFLQIASAAAELSIQLIKSRLLHSRPARAKRSLSAARVPSPDGSREERNLMAPLNFSTTLTRYSLRHNCGLARPCSMGGDAQRRAQFWISALYP